MLPFLAYIFTLVLMNISYGVIKGLGKQKIFILLIIFFNTSSMFVIWILIEIGVGMNSMSFGLLLKELSVLTAGILIIGLADWRKEADVIVNKSE